MGTRTVTCDKSLRDIWNATDKSTINILQGTGKLSQNISSHCKTPPPVKQYHVASDSQPRKTDSHFNSLKNDNYKKIHGLFQNDVCKLEDDNVSLHSIWTPTNNDNLKKEELKSFYESPLIDLGISENTKPANAYNFSTNSSRGTDDSPFIDLNVHENYDANIYDSSNDYNNESALIDFGSFPKPTNMYTLPKDYSQGKVSSHYSGNKQNIDSYSEKSLDELNEETFGKFSYPISNSELTLSDLSESTAAYNRNKDQNVLKTPRVSEYSESESTQDAEEIKTGTKPKTFINKVYRQNNMQPFLPRKDRERSCTYKKTRKSEGLKASDVTSVSSNSDEMLSQRRENLNICKARPIQGKLRKNARSNERRRADNCETFQRKSFQSDGTGITSHTQETFYKNGNTSYYKAEKITYVQGKKLDNTYEDRENKIVWRNASEISRINDRDTGKIYNMHIRNDAVYNHHNKGIALSNSNKKYNYEKHKLDADNSYTFKNQNNSMRHEQKQFNSIDDRKQSIGKVYQGGKLTFSDETTAQCVWQSIDNLNISCFDEMNSAPQDNTFENNNLQEINNIEHNDKKNNVTHFKVYNPKLHRPTKMKININQASGCSKNSREQINSKTISDKYVENVKLKNSSFDNLQNKISENNYMASNDSANKNYRDRFQFLENMNQNKTDNENKTYVKDLPCNIKLPNTNNAPEAPKQLKNSTAKKNDAKEFIKSSIIRDGKEIADLIVGCHRALDMFKSFYYEWIDLRKQSINLLEQIVMIIDQSSRKKDTMKQVIAAINIAANAVNIIPHPGVALGVRVAGAVGGFLANFFKGTDNKKEVNAKEFEIKEIFQRDIDSSSYVYIYGVQCGSQFQETCDAIGKFNKKLLERDYLSIIDNDELLEFMNAITEYNNTNTVLFYKRLRMCYERLIKSSNSNDSKAFVRLFEDVPEAISVIDLLPWKFDSDGFDNRIVQNTWDELFLLFQDGNPATVDTIKKKIEDCLFFLKKEHRILSRNVTGLFKETFKQL